MCVQQTTFPFIPYIYEHKTMIEGLHLLESYATEDFPEAIRVSVDQQHKRRSLI